MAMTITLIRAHPAHSFAIWMLTCTQLAGVDGPYPPAVVNDVDPDPGLPNDCAEGTILAPGSTCAECLNALVGNGTKKGVDPFAGLNNIKVTYTQLGSDVSLIQILIGL